MNRICLFLLCVLLASRAWAANPTDGVVEFTSQSCGPCQLMRPIVAGLPITVIDYETNTELAQSLGVKSLPTFVKLERGAVVDRLVGMQAADTLVRFTSPKSKMVLAHSAKPPQICRVDCGRCFGTGTLIDVPGYVGIVATAYHVTQGMAQATADFGPYGKHETTYLGGDKQWDVSFLQLKDWRDLGKFMAGVKPIPLATAAPKPGDPIDVGGFGPVGEFRLARGLTIGYTSPVGRNIENDMLQVGNWVRQGDSGGAMLNTRGELAGVLWGTNGDTYGTYCGRITLLMAKTFPQYVEQVGLRNRKGMFGGGGGGAGRGSQGGQQVPMGGPSPMPTTPAQPVIESPVGAIGSCPPGACPPGGCPPGGQTVVPLIPTPGDSVPVAPAPDPAKTIDAADKILAAIELLKVSQAAPQQIANAVADVKAIAADIEKAKAGQLTADDLKRLLAEAPDRLAQYKESIDGIKAAVDAVKTIQGRQDETLAGQTKGIIGTLEAVKQSRDGVLGVAAEQGNHRWWLVGSNGVVLLVLIVVGVAIWLRTGGVARLHGRVEKVEAMAAGIGADVGGAVLGLRSKVQDDFAAVRRKLADLIDAGEKTNPPAPPAA